MKLNKTLASALLLSVALTGCDSIVKNDNTAENTPVVEENTDAPAETTENEATETVETETTTDEAANNEETTETTETTTDGNSAEETTNESSSEQAADTSNMSIEQKKEMLEQAIFDNRSQARAAELLLELTPEKVADIEPQLQQLIDESNALLEQAQRALDQLNAQ